MDHPTTSPGGPPAESESYLGIVANLAGLLAAVVLLVVFVRSSSRPTGTPAPLASAPAPITAPPPPTPVAAPAPAPEPEPEPPAPPKPVVKPLDRAAIAEAEGRIDAASRDRARAEARANAAARRLADATAQAALDAAKNRKLAFQVRDPSAQLASVSTRGAYLRAEHKRLKAALDAVVQAPRPKAKSLVDKNPVAKPTEGNEYHFEIRRDRVAYIDLDRLLDLCKADAQRRIRISDNSRVVESRVGPVGAFSLEYSLGRALPQGIEELMERHGLRYDLQGWEVVPEYDTRGETYERARQPISQYSLTLNRLSPSRATITMWIYPDGFSLYRKLRDDLHARGFTVAARPLPDGMAIRGSPAGSLSAGQ